jgi:predicted RNase H-like HicB family nuclease
MSKELDYTYWQDGDFFVGYINDYPDDSTQGETLEDLEDALREVYEIRQEEKQHLVSIQHKGKLKVAV